jgi:hypothetical protein
VVAGLDIAEQAAKQSRLPPVTRAEDVENYPTDKLLDLAFHMGILTHPEWRRMKRSYEIRRDLEHEDDLYEAGVEDCVYVSEPEVVHRRRRKSASWFRSGYLIARRVNRLAESVRGTIIRARGGFRAVDCRLIRGVRRRFGQGFPPPGKLRRQFLYCFQPFQRQTLRKAEHR